MESCGIGRIRDAWQRRSLALVSLPCLLPIMEQEVSHVRGWMLQAASSKDQLTISVPLT